jgi:hypothetical protein
MEARMSARKRWARLRDDVDVKLRRGAWYRVLEESELDAVIEVNEKPKSVLKALLEIVERPHPKWTVVRLPERAKGAPATLGERYGVCPSCGERAPLKAKARRMACPSCKWEFDVAWDEGYLE